YGPQNDVTLKMPAFEWVHVQLHQQKGMISLSPPTICNSATLSDGNTPPLGAEVFDSKEIAIGAVGQGGLLYARVPDIKGVLHVVWGDNSVQRCQLAYSVNQQTSRNLCK
ncbi:FimD/PapC C-terminal domain-containing protein, partial [Escherichia coli]